MLTSASLALWWSWPGLVCWICHSAGDIVPQEPVTYSVLVAFPLVQPPSALTVQQTAESELSGQALWGALPLTTMGPEPDSVAFNLAFMPREK